MITPTEEERAEVIELLNQIRNEQTLPTLTAALLWALRRCPRARSQLTDEQPRSRSWWGKEYNDVDVYEAALERTRHAFATFDHCFVSFSGGKTRPPS